MPRPLVRAIAPAALIAAAGLMLAACGSDDDNNAASTTTAAPTTTEAPASSTVASARAAVKAAENPTIGEDILVDRRGLTLYVWDQDTTANESVCDTMTACVSAWPPAYVTGTPTYGDGLDASMFSTFKAPSGRTQLAVNGKPLYLWVNDKKPGDATGQGVNGFYVVGTDGNKIDED
jgi:predicted lipoprotein with Yx(FWY)xxD motif